MCGIAGFILNPAHKQRGFPATALARELLLEIEHRGRDATGMLALKSQAGMVKPKIAYHKEAIRAEEFVKKYRVPEWANIVLLHTRFATQGHQSNNVNNHPVHFENCYAVHNGHISNDDKVLAEYDIKPEERPAEVDSIAIAVALAREKMDGPKQVRNALEKLRGGFAIAACDPFAHPGRIVLAKGTSSPLHTLTTPAGVFWASERKSLEKAWERTIGTPPNGYAHEPGKPGFKAWWDGDYWILDAKPEEMLNIIHGKFTVPASYHTGGSGRNDDYTYKPREWTCWPNTKDCIFGAACTNCDNGKCVCYKGNSKHPRLNPDLTYERVIGWHGAKMKLNDAGLKREDIEFIPPTKGRELSLGDTTFVECDKCSLMRNKKDIAVRVLDDGESFICNQCVGSGGDGVDDDGRPENFLEMETRADTTCKWIDDAVYYTAIDNDISPELVHYLVFYRKNMENPHWQAFRDTIKEQFNKNMRTVIDGVHPDDGSAGPTACDVNNRPQLELVDEGGKEEDK